MRFCCAFIVAVLGSSAALAAAQSVVPGPLPNATSHTLKVDPGEKLLIELETSLNTRARGT